MILSASVAIWACSAGVALGMGTLNTIQKEYGNQIDDSHNANLDGVLNSLNLVQSFDGKKIVF